MEKEGPFDVITCFNYRHRDLFPFIRERLKVGGFLLAEVTTVPNLERHAQSYTHGGYTARGAGHADRCEKEMFPPGHRLPPKRGPGAARHLRLQHQWV